jgi:hypothetical protein
LTCASCHPLMTRVCHGNRERGEWS